MKEEKKSGAGVLLGPFRYLQCELDADATTFPPLQVHIPLLGYSMETEVGRPNVQSKISVFRQVQNNPKITSSQPSNHLFIHGRTYQFGHLCDKAGLFK